MHRIHNKPMFSQYWNLDLLSRAVRHKNLSGAASHVGLSQPQLSRVIARLEKELGVQLLDRSVRRKSGWTPQALQLAECFSQASQQLQKSVEYIQGETFHRQLHLGTLEGLIPMSVQLGRRLMEKNMVKSLELNVHDLSELEEKFVAQDLDVVFTVRTPGQRKYRYVQEIGHLLYELVDSKDPIHVLSPYESVSMGGRERAKLERTLLSNSLAVRAYWLENVGGVGHVPSHIKSGRPPVKQLSVPVFILGQDRLNPQIWSTLMEQARG